MKHYFIDEIVWEDVEKIRDFLNYIFLEILLQVIAARKNLRLIHFKDLVQL